jgi:hypothetical protein
VLQQFEIPTQAYAEEERVKKEVDRDEESLIDGLRLDFVGCECLSEDWES